MSVAQGRFDTNIEPDVSRQHTCVKAAVIKATLRPMIVADGTNGTSATDNVWDDPGAAGASVAVRGGSGPRKGALHAQNSGEAG